jgi:fructose-1,6-bisphosphatase/inositol monophosphatase family enzyme
MNPAQIDLRRIDSELEAVLLSVPNSRSTTARIIRSDSNPETELDENINRYLKRELSKIVDIPIISEEGPAESLIRCGLCWVVDPVDGTINLIAGIDDFAVCVSLVDASQRQPLLSAVYLPRSRQMFKAVTGEGAYHNGVLLSTHRPRKSRERQRIVAFGVPGEGPSVANRMSDAFAKLLTAGWVTRQFGAASIDICRVAVGSWSAFFEYGLMYWDFVASALIATEAGCSICAVALQPSDSSLLPLKYDLVVARTPKILEQVSAAVGIYPNNDLVGQ